MSEKLTEVNTFMLETFQTHNIEDTTENRITFLEGLWDSWNEQSEDDLPIKQALDKMLYMLAVHSELVRLRFLS